MMKVRLEAGQGAFEATLREGPIAQALRERLPLTATVQRWGDEIYFDVLVKMKNTAPTREVTVGDIAYWPDGPCLCIFFGKTPVSKASEPRPASDVTIIGHTDAAPTFLRSVGEGTPITVSALPAPARSPRS